MSMAEDTRKRLATSNDQYGAQRREADNDPLAELARLIGQSDPFTDAGRRPGNARSYDAPRADDHPAPEWLLRPSTSPDRNEHGHDDHAQAGRHSDYDAQSYQHGAYHDQQGDYRQPERGYHDDGRYADDQYYTDQTQGYAASGNNNEYPGYADDRYQVAPPAHGDYGPDQYYAEDGHMPPRADQDGATGRRRSGLITVGAVVGLAVLGTAGAFAYRSFGGASGSSNPPVIKADTSPAKIAGPATTTASIDGQNKPFQDRVGNPVQTERIVPREEQPVAFATSQTRGLTPPPSVSAPMTTAPSASAPPSANEPKKVRTVVIRQDGSSADPAAAALSPPAVARAAPNMPAAKQAPQPDPRAAAAPTRTASIGRTDGGYIVQVSAQKSQDEAEASYRALQQKYPAVLGGREATIRRADLGDKGVYYRAQIGPFTTSDQARTFCDSLKSAGGQCMVQKP